MTITEAQIRAASRGIQQDRAFVYFRHTPSGVKFIVSRDLTEMGKPKQLLRSSDPGYHQAARFVDALIAHARNYGFGGRGGMRPTAQALSRFVENAAQTAGVEATFLPKSGFFGDRILMKI